MPEYDYDTWYSKDAIDNIISLKHMISHYRVTYDSYDKTFIVHQKASALPDMEFRKHKFGLHVLYPEYINNLVLLNTVK